MLDTVEMEIESWVRDLLLEVSFNMKGYDVYLGGGYLRDLYCNLDYKDLDIFLVPNGEKKGIRPYKPKGYFELYTKECDNDDMSERGVAGLIGFRFKSTYKDSDGFDTIDESVDYKQANTELQYIIYEDNVINSIEDLCEDMDMTINQVMWVPDVASNTCYCTENFIYGHKCGYIDFSHEYDEVRMYCRQKRMQEKFPHYICLDNIYLSSSQIEELHDKGEHEYEGSA